MNDSIKHSDDDEVCAVTYTWGQVKTFLKEHGRCATDSNAEALLAECGNGSIGSTSTTRTPSSGPRPTRTAGWAERLPSPMVERDGPASLSNSSSQPETRCFRTFAGRPAHDGACAGRSTERRAAAPPSLDFLLGRLPTARIVTASTPAPRSPDFVRRARGRYGG